MAYYRVTHANGLTEIMGNPTPKEEREFFKRAVGVVRFPSIDHRVKKKTKARKKE